MSRLDAGWFGTGMYFTSNASYALRYAKGPRALIMCYVAILNPFPIVSSDAPREADPSAFRFYGRGNHRNFQSHYVGVERQSPSPQCIDYRPPTTNCASAEFDELVVFQESAILPQIVVYLK
jgi:hypothetical protein